MAKHLALTGVCVARECRGGVASQAGGGNCSEKRPMRGVDTRSSFVSIELRSTGEEVAWRLAWSKEVT